MCRSFFSAEKKRLEKIVHYAPRIDIFFWEWYD